MDIATVIEVMQDELGEAIRTGSSVSATISNWGEITATPASKGWDLELTIHPAYRAQWGLEGAIMRDLANEESFAFYLAWLVQDFVTSAD